MYRILIADDHPIVRRGLIQILEEAKVKLLIEEASNGREAVEKAVKGKFDVAMLDVSMPEMDGLAALQEIKKQKPSLPVLMLSIYPEEEFALRALKAGASGYLTKKSAPDELLGAVRKLAKGGRYISPTLADHLALKLTEPGNRPLHESLSNREFYVMRCIASGKAIKEIAAEMSLSPKTISTFRTRILQKMNMKSNAELIQYTVKHNLSE